MRLPYWVGFLGIAGITLAVAAVHTQGMGMKGMGRGMGMGRDSARRSTTFLPSSSRITTRIDHGVLLANWEV